MTPKRSGSDTRERALSGGRDSSYLGSSFRFLFSERGLLSSLTCRCSTADVPMCTGGHVSVMSLLLSVVIGGFSEHPKGLRLGHDDQKAARGGTSPEVVRLEMRDLRSGEKTDRG